LFFSTEIDFYFILAGEAFQSIKGKKNTNLWFIHPNTVDTSTDITGRDYGNSCTGEIVKAGPSILFVKKCWFKPALHTYR
jgi:hypothetical protein